jgi:membrane protease YdiL (CAAX protease family)
MVRLPQTQVPDLSRASFLTLLSLLVMSAVVSGIVEEASFRGYMQAPLERRHGPLVAILVTGFMFGLAHFSHPEVTIALMPYYMAAAAIYGAMAYFTNSILPGVILHGGGNFLSSLGLLAAGRELWPTAAMPASLIWETGPDASFWVALIATIVLGSATVFAYAELAKMTRATRALRSVEFSAIG